MFFRRAIVIFFTGLVASNTGAAQSAGEDIRRFVALSAGEANLRTGPGTRYPIDWVYQRRGLPLAIIDERDTWRKVRDKDGTEGWMHVSLLTRRRTAMITGATRKLYADANSGSRIRMEAEAGVIGRLSKCDGLWCRLIIDNTAGWIERRHLWGVGKDEKLD